MSENVDPSAPEGWHPIAELRQRERVYLGRWDKIGNLGTEDDWLWQQYEGHWFNWRGTVTWSWGDQNPFFLRQLPTHFHYRLLPPQRPESNERG